MPQMPPAAPVTADQPGHPLYALTATSCGTTAGPLSTRCGRCPRTRRSAGSYRTGSTPCRPKSRTARGWPVADPVRPHDVHAMTAGELDRASRELRAGLALTRPGSPARVPILAHMSAIDAELAKRSAVRDSSGASASG